MSDTHAPSLLSNERLTETPRPLPYKQRMSLTQEALTGLPAHTNDAAHFQGQRGYWVQGEAVFIPCSNAGTAISFYRQRFNSGDIAASHNLATAAVGRMKAAAALDEFRQAVAEQLRGLLVQVRPLSGCFNPTAQERERINSIYNAEIKAAAARLQIDLTA